MLVYEPRMALRAFRKERTAERMRERERECEGQRDRQTGKKRERETETETTAEKEKASVLGAISELADVTKFLFIHFAVFATTIQIGFRRCNSEFAKHHNITFLVRHETITTGHF